MQVRPADMCNLPAYRKIATAATIIVYVTESFLVNTSPVLSPPKSSTKLQVPVLPSSEALQATPSAGDARAQVEQDILWNW